MNRLQIALIVAAIGASIYFMTLPAETAEGLQSRFMSFISPFLRTGAAVGENIGRVGERLKTLEELEVENRQLTEENRQLRASNSLLRELEAENARLRMAIDFRERSSFNLLPARIVGRDASTWWNTVRINRGFENGVESDQPVVTDKGLVGKVTTVSKNEAIVVLVTDETCRLGAKIEGTREQGILSGIRIQPDSPEARLQLNFLSKNAEIEPGQEVVTAGVVHGSFPPGILVGKVVDFQRRSLDGQAVVEPAVNLSSMEDVFVLLDRRIPLDETLR